MQVERRRVPIEGGTFVRRHRAPDYGNRPHTVVIPVWISGAEAQEVRVSAVCAAVNPAEPGAVRVEPVSLVSYDPDTLPIRLRSHMPYTATVRTDRLCDLETHREFVPGYEARVNGRLVEPARTANGLLTVPLPAGDNEVVLVYRGPPVVRVAFVVSCSGWLALAGFALPALAGNCAGRSARARGGGAGTSSVTGSAPGPLRGRARLVSVGI